LIQQLIYTSKYTLLYVKPNISPCTQLPHVYDHRWNILQFNQLCNYLHSKQRAPSISLMPELPTQCGINNHIHLHKALYNCRQPAFGAYSNNGPFEYFSPLSSKRSQLSWRTTHGKNILRDGSNDHCLIRGMLRWWHHHRSWYHTSYHLLMVSGIVAQNRNVWRTYRHWIHELDNWNRRLLDPQLRKVVHGSCVQTTDLVWWQQLEGGEDRTGSRCKTSSTETGSGYNELRYSSDNTNFRVHTWFVHSYGSWRWHLVSWQWGQRRRSR